MQEEFLLVDLRVGQQVVNSRRVSARRPSDNAVDFVTLGEEEFREITSVLTGDSRNQS
jgi:hypothetical protein